MKEYIERGALLNKIWMGNSDSIVLRGYAADMVNSAPTADVKEVVHAKWIWFNAWEGDDTFGEWKMLCCSHCLESEGARENAKYCPNCGAIMDLAE